MNSTAKHTQVVFFDIGGVLIEIHPERTMNHWAEKAGVSPVEIQKIFPEEAFHSYERGAISGDEFFTRFNQVLPGEKSISRADFWEGWKQLLGKENGSVDVLKQLSRTYPVWLLSNTNPQHIRDELGLRVSFLEYITGAIYSFDAGARKPDARIFEFALGKAGVEASRALFIDDIHANVSAARSLGFCALQFFNTGKLIQELEQLGFQLELPARRHRV